MSPTPEMIEAGLKATVDGEKLDLAAIYLAMESAKPTDEAAVERVADALCGDVRARVIAGKESSPAFQDCGDEVQEYWRSIARAAIAALNQPATKGEGE